LVKINSTLELTSYYSTNSLLKLELKSGKSTAVRVERNSKSFKYFQHNPNFLSYEDSTVERGKVFGHTILCSNIKFIFCYANYLIAHKISNIEKHQLTLKSNQNMQRNLVKAC